MPCPAFPPDLEQEIFEAAAEINLEGIPSLLLVCHRVHTWIEKIQYRTFIHDFSVSSFGLLLKVIQFKSKPPSFFRDHVRHLLVRGGSWTESELNNVLSTCGGIPPQRALGSTAAKEEAKSTLRAFPIWPPPACPLCTTTTALLWVLLLCTRVTVPSAASVASAATSTTGLIDIPARARCQWPACTIGRSLHGIDPSHSCCGALHRPPYLTVCPHTSPRTPVPRSAPYLAHAPVPCLSRLLCLCTPSTAALACVRWADGRTSLLCAAPAPLHLAAFHTDILQHPWYGTTIARVHYAALQEAAGLHGTIAQLCTDRLLFVSGVSNAEMGDAACELRALAGGCSTGSATATFALFAATPVPFHYITTSTLRGTTAHTRGGRTGRVALRNRMHGGALCFIDTLHAAAPLCVHAPLPSPSSRPHPSPFTASAPAAASDAALGRIKLLIPDAAVALIAATSISPSTPSIPGTTSTPRTLEGNLLPAAPGTTPPPPGDPFTKVLAV
ncbi:hypothetical protein DFH07DRAFT_963834 [Mycena maculata]|uniref:Uncharacterized protein n=1 Tax=Mycena maculata TaxID=230809 RepID=A0AAD7IJ18_9AGAR|nr:hypothetical protein DFH07DRAFT_963834 [Mycena maculata]